MESIKPNQQIEIKSLLRSGRKPSVVCNSTAGCRPVVGDETQRLRGLIANKPLVIFSKSTCCLCHSIKSLVYSLGANPAIYDVDEIPNGQQLERELQKFGQNPTVPAVFIGQEFVGGAQEILSLHSQGKLVQLLGIA